MNNKAYFKSLDGLRGLAAIAAALFHWLLSFSGYLAVDFFLVLSGFILAHRYLYTETTSAKTTLCSLLVGRVHMHCPMRL